MEQAVRDSSAQASAAGFSKTVVEVELHEPDLLDLTLLDLPGIVNSGGSKEFVKELVQEHIDGIAVPCFLLPSQVHDWPRSRCSRLICLPAALSIA